MTNLPSLEVRGFRVLTTNQIAEAYETTKDKIIYNFNYNKCKYVLGKHYIEVTGDELRRLKTTFENQISFKYAKCLYLWTEKGALLHAKSLNTDKAWEVYDYLVDFYFRAKKEVLLPAESTKKEVVPVTQSYDPLPDFTISNPIGTLETLLSFAHKQNLTVKSLPFKAYYSRLKGKRIGIATNLTVERVCYEVAYELSHAMLHADVGDIMNSCHQEEYNRRAHNAAIMLLSFIEQK